MKLFCLGKTQDELLAVWLQEAKAAIGGKKKGSVVEIWKVIRERKVGRHRSSDRTIRRYRCMITRNVPVKALISP